MWVMCELEFVDLFLLSVNGFRDSPIIILRFPGTISRLSSALMDIDINLSAIAWPCLLSGGRENGLKRLFAGKTQ